MPTEQPTSAPDTTPQPNDRDTAANVLHGSLDMPAGGGSLGGASAADPLGGSARTPSGNAPNAPIDTGVDGDNDAAAAAEARVQASQADPVEPQSVFPMT